MQTRLIAFVHQPPVLVSTHKLKVKVETNIRGNQLTTIGKLVFLVLADASKIASVWFLYCTVVLL